jgi:hypothetical protein
MDSVFAFFAYNSSPSDSKARFVAPLLSSAALLLTVGAKTEQEH